MLIDWVEVFQPLTKKGNWHWGEDGKVRMNFTALFSDSSWLQTGPLIAGIEGKNFDCSLLHIYHTHVFKSQAIHSFCHECYKVVVRLEVLAQVHKMAEWQRGVFDNRDIPCKVGAEKRTYVGRDWGAYFYCRGLEEGRNRYQEVRKWVDDELGEDVDVILKRGCTEFEISLGDSDKWKMIDRQEEVEAEGEKVIDYIAKKSLHEVIDDHTSQNWNEWAVLTRKPVTYHEEGE